MLFRWDRAQELNKSCQLVPEESPVGDSDSNGESESMNSVVEGLIKAHKNQAEELATA